MREAIPAREALLLQLAAFAGNEPGASKHEIRTLRPDGRPGRREFVGVRDRHGAAEAILALDDVNVYIGAAPRVRESGTAADVERVWCAWADCDSEASVEALRHFRPLPSIVVRTSPGRVQALWPLRSAVEPSWARRANRRLAYALGADMAATDPARILRAIGTRNHKHSPPAPVTCARLELAAFALADVVGSLPDAPGDARAVPRDRVRSATPGSLAGLTRSVREAHVGERNALLFWAACTATDEGLDAREELRQAAFDAGLPEHEIERTLDSAEQRFAA